MPGAIVTGGAVRLGQAMVLHLAGKGYDIALHYGASKDAARDVISQVRELGVKCEGYPCDLTDPAAAESLIDKITGEFSNIELLINSAANFIQEDIEHTRTRILLDTLNLNLAAPYLLMREYKKHVNRGMIVNILDERVSRHVPAFAAYSVSKAALAHLTRLGAVEFGATVHVNGIAPGLILPPAGATDEYLRREAKKVPTRTHGFVEDVLRGLDYLIASPFVNGEILYIDGGQSKGPARG